MARMKSLKKLCMYRLIGSTAWRSDILTDDLKQEIESLSKLLFKLKPAELVKRCAYNKALAAYVINNKSLYGCLMINSFKSTLSWLSFGFYVTEGQNDTKLKTGGYVYDLFCYHDELYLKCKESKHELISVLSEHQIRSIERGIKYRNDARAWSLRHNN
jgi:hypothetical protein